MERGVKVYIAGPYSVGDVAQNVKRAMDVADFILEECGCVPFVPHLTHFWHLVSPKPYLSWLAYDKIWLLECDCVVRILGYSAGADEEVTFAHGHKIPVYCTFDPINRDEQRKDLIQWLSQISPRGKTKGR